MEQRSVLFSLPHIYELDICVYQIPQLYVHHPAAANEPPSVLRGFADVTLGPGEQQEVTIALSRYDLSIWDVVTQSWRRPKGEISFDIGASSRDFRLNGVIP